MSIGQRSQENKTLGLETMVDRLVPGPLFTAYDREWTSSHPWDDVATLRAPCQPLASLFSSSDLTSRKWAISLYFGETQKGAEMRTEGAFGEGHP